MNKITKAVVITFIITSLTIAIIYNILNNNKIRIVTEEIAVDDLPNSFDGFTILQISDLHGKSFGHNQEKLLNVINNCKYDIIAATGDMKDKSSDNIDPFIDLLKGLKNKEFLFYVKGNSDDPYYDKKEKKETAMGLLLEENGCKFVDHPYPIRRGNDTLWVSGLFSSAVLRELSKNIKPEDIKLALTHYPMDQKFYESVTFNEIPDYNLILAGHYHGGQWRIPLYGAVFIPDLDGRGLFPKQSIVSGLNEWGNYKQYVSRGLGASSDIPLFKFRLFNTPEINLITLVKK